MSVGKIGKFTTALGCMGYALNCCLSFALPMFGVPTHSFSIGGVLISLSFYCGYICMIFGFGLLLFARKDVSGVLMAALTLLAFLSVLTHQSRQVFHGRSLYLLKAIAIEHLANGVEYIVTFRHFYRRKVSCSFRYTWFCCHNESVFKLTGQKYE